MHAEALMHAEHAPNRVQAHIFEQVAGMKVGQWLRVEARDMLRAFPPDGLFSGRPPEDQFLEKMIGANYGAWTCVLDPTGGYYLIGQHEIGDSKVRDDWDRR